MAKFSARLPRSRLEKPPGGYSSEFLVPNFRPKYSVFHTRFQTWPLNFIPVFRPLLYRNYALHQQRSQELVNFSSNDIFWILIFLYFSFGAEKTNTFIRSRGSLENHTRFKTIMVKSIPVFRPKWLKNHTLWGGTYLYRLYRGVPPPGGGKPRSREPSQPALSYEHIENFYTGFRGKARSRKPGQPGQPGSYEEALR